MTTRSNRCWSASQQGLGDGSGLIYSMGHLTPLRPRAKLLKRFARSLAEKSGMGDRLNLIESIER